MQYQEFGSTEKETILLLHGGGLSWWNYREVASLLEDSYHIILPILDGHAGSDHPFTSIEENAHEIIAWIDAHYGGSVSLIGGLSLGAQILLEILAQRPDICSYALIESASVIPSRLTNALIGPAFGSTYRLIQNKTFARLQFRQLHIQPSLFEDYYRDTSRIRKSDMIAFMKANTAYRLKESLRGVSAKTHVYYGSKETRGIRRSAETIAGKLPDCSLHCLQGFYHGDLSLNHPVLYAGTVRQILNEEA